MFDETLYLNSRIYIIIALIGMIFLQYVLLIDQETANFSNPGFDLASWKAQSALWWFLIRVTDDRGYWQSLVSATGGFKRGPLNNEDVISCSTKIFGASLKLNTPIFFERPYLIGKSPFFDKQRSRSK